MRNDDSSTRARLDRLEARLLAGGLDLTRRFDASSYDRAIVDHPRLCPVVLPSAGSRLGLAVGNTRALWEPLLAAMQCDVGLRESPDPVDDYVSTTLRRALAETALPHRLHLASEGGDALVSMLHVAEVSGLAHRGPAHLAVRADHGPWFAMRALVVFDVEAPAPVTSAEPSPCAGCDRPCVDALQRALDNAEQLPVVAADLAPSWRDWLAVRDACPLGRPSRYGENQIEYHYAKTRRALRNDDA